jgi:hypothetical protein
VPEQHNALLLRTLQEVEMAIREFEAHETRSVPTPVRFKTREGKLVRFIADEPKRVRKHVRFKTRDHKRS